MSQKGFSSTRLIRSLNASIVLQTLYRHGRCSRTQLTRLTHISPATITRIINELMQQGIVYEGTQAKSTGGRKPVYLHLDYSKLYIVSVQLIRDRTAVALLDLRGELLLKRSMTPTSFTPETLLPEVCREIESILAQGKVNEDHILGVGVAISGVVDSTTGVMVKSVNLGWENVPVAQILSERLDLPIYVANDANAAALAELWFGQCQDADSFLYLKTDTGAGVGLVVSRNLVSGPQWLAGEIGHVPVIPGGRQCRCGQRGCLEAYVYMADVVRQYSQNTGRSISVSDFMALLQVNDPEASFLVKETAHAIGQAVCAWGILLDLDKLVIGGVWGQMNELVIEPIQAQYQAILKRSGLDRRMSIIGSSLSDDNDLFGAAGIVIHSWLSPKLVTERGGDRRR
ncbi:MAG: ROK family transcriptional regulator [Firmicutes bacterium]|nr:ROK family transcriptional regulator [Bacillota bacterium]